MQHLLEVVRSGASVADVTFLVNYLNHQVTDCKRVTQMLKTHVLLHRLLLDSGEEFRTQIMKMHKWVVEDRNTDSTLKCLFSIRAWKDETSMEVSGWCRTYASYLDEFVANWEDFSDFARINKNPTGSETQMRSLPADELVRKLPICQLMMRRIIDCEAINDSLTANEVVIAATRLLFRDSFKWYHMCNDGVIRLIDLFFDMNKHHAAKALEMYKKATVQGDDLSRMYRNAEENWLAFRSEKFPVVENPPGSFLQTMEEYVKNAPAEGKGPAPSPPSAAAPAPAQQAPVVDPMSDLLGGMSLNTPSPQQQAPAAAATTFDAFGGGDAFGANGSAGFTGGSAGFTGGSAGFTGGSSDFTNGGAGFTGGSAAQATPSPTAAAPQNAFSVSPPVAAASSPTKVDFDPFGTSAAAAAPIAPPGAAQAQGGAQGPPSVNPFGSNPFGAPEQPKPVVDLDSLYAQGGAPVQTSPPQQMGGDGDGDAAAGDDAAARHGDGHGHAAARHDGDATARHGDGDATAG